MKKCLIISDDKTYDLKLLKSLKKEFSESLQIENIITLFDNNKDFQDEFNCPVNNLNQILNDFDYYSKNYKNTFDHNDYEKYSFIEYFHNIALSFNHIIGEFDLNEVRLDFIRNLTVCNKILEERKIENVIFTNIPHNQFTVVLLKLLEKKNIRYLILRETIVGNYIIEDSLEKKIEKKIEKKFSKKINLSLENFINYMKTGKNNVNFKNFRNHSIINKKIYNIFFFGKFFFYINRLINFGYEQIRNTLKLITYINSKNKKIFIDDKFKKKKFNFKDSKINIFQRTNYLLIQDIKKYNLYKHYKEISIDRADYNEKYIYFPLHYQPEATTVPYGNFYFDQINAIKILSNLSDQNNFKIFVKEHPDTFNISKSAWTMGMHTRYLNYYKNISEIKNVRLLNLKLNNLELIKNSYCVATITGTTAVEALYQKKNSIIFGNAWFEGMSNAFKKYSNLEDLKIFFKNFKNLKKLKNEDFLEFIENLNEQSAHLSKSGVYKNNSEEFSNLTKLFKDNIGP